MLFSRTSRDFWMTYRTGNFRWRIKTRKWNSNHLLLQTWFVLFSLQSHLIRCSAVLLSLSEISCFWNFFRAVRSSDQVAQGNMTLWKSMPQVMTIVSSMLIQKRNRYFTYSSGLLWLAVYLIFLSSSFKYYRGMNISSRRSSMRPSIVTLGVLLYHQTLWLFQIGLWLISKSKG